MNENENENEKGNKIWALILETVDPVNRDDLETALSKADASDLEAQITGVLGVGVVIRLTVAGKKEGETA